jgi:hypothetical protein
MKRPSPSFLPTTQTRTIQDPETELLVSTFADRIQILISQKSGKVGTMLSCSHEFSHIDNSHTYHIETLLGDRNDALNSVYARQIMERLVKLGDGINCPPLLLGITLNGKSSQEDFKLIVDEVVALYQDAIRAIGANS